MSDSEAPSPSATAGSQPLPTAARFTSALDRLRMTLFKALTPEFFVRAHVELADEPAAVAVP